MCKVRGDNYMALNRSVGRREPTSKRLTKRNTWLAGRSTNNKVSASSGIAARVVGSQGLRRYRREVRIGLAVLAGRWGGGETASYGTRETKSGSFLGKEKRGGTECEI